MDTQEPKTESQEQVEKQLIESGWRVVEEGKPLPDDVNTAVLMCDVVDEKRQPTGEIRADVFRKPKHFLIADSLAEMGQFERAFKELRSNALRAIQEAAAPLQEQIAALKELREIDRRGYTVSKRK